jgi:hypothetical protein
LFERRLKMEEGVLGLVLDGDFCLKLKMMANV